MKIKWTRGAKNNLALIHHYIMQDKPKSAVNIVMRIIKAVELLSDNPTLGKLGRILIPAN